MTLKEFALEIPALRDEAKQLWGEEPWTVPLSKDSDLIPNWKVKFDEMLESDDPKKYLRENTK